VEWSRSEWRFISTHTSCPKTGDLVVEELMDGRCIKVRCFAPTKQFIKRPPELTWLRLLSISALRPERRLLLAQETGILPCVYRCGTDIGVDDINALVRVWIGLKR